MKFMLDTNICIHLMQRQPEAVMQKFAGLQVGDVVMSSITYAELRYGVECRAEGKAALAGALKLITRASNPITEGTIVFIVCDGGWKYLSTGAWTDDLDEVTERAAKIIYF